MLVRVVHYVGLSVWYIVSIATQEVAVLRWSAIFFVIAIVAAVLGFSGIAGAAASIAKVLFIVFLVVFVVTFLLGRTRR